jgi:hypothetical protein
VGVFHHEAARGDSVAADNCSMTLIAPLTPSSRLEPPAAPGPATAGQRGGGRRAAPGLARLWRAFKRLTALGFPRRFPIVQFPNLPLIIAFLAGEAGQFVHGAEHTYTASVSYLAMTIWAYEELSHGVNWFRRLLGIAYAIIMVVRVAHAIA